MIKQTNLQRRTFIKTAATGGAALTMFGVNKPASARPVGANDSLRIERIIAHVVEIKLGFTYSTGTQTTARAIIWEIAAGDHTGLGECNLALHEATPGIHVKVQDLPKALSPWVSPLFGRDAKELEALLPPMPRRLNWDLLVTREGLSIALYDLVGKAHGLPVHTLLGGRRRNRVPGMPVIHVGPVDVMIRRAGMWLDAGYRFLKVKLCGNFKNDSEAVHGIRKLAGPNVSIQVDANAGYKDLAEAEKAVRSLMPCQIDSFEDVFDAPVEQIAELRRRTGARIMVDREAYWPNVYEITQTGAFDVVNHHPNNQGGLATALQIDAVATAAGLQTAIGSSGLFGIQDAAFQMLASVIGLSRPCEDIGLPPYYSGPTKGQYSFDHEPSVIRKPFPIRNGVINIPDTPGLGVELDRKKLECLTVDKIEFTR